MKQTLVLAILDGWGLGRHDETNPIHVAKPGTIETIEKYFPAGALQASGIAAGLPWDEEGNSEVGHLTIGAGKILYQHFPKISLSIDDGSFFKNEALGAAFTHARATNGSVHAIGLLTQGNVHASFKHLLALIEMAHREKAKQFYLHLFTDGRDGPPRSALPMIKELSKIIATHDGVVIASISGRHYAMDRDGHWDRTEQVFRILTKPDQKIEPVEAVLEKAYAKNLSDEFVIPTATNGPYPIKNDDAVIFFNFREDSMRQITEPFLNTSFNRFDILPIKNLAVTTMTSYQESSSAKVAFFRETINNPLGKILSDNKKNQLRIAETDKYAHVTYFFNGLREDPFPNEYRVLIPSWNVVHQDEKPEMRAEEITDRILIALNEGSFDFILANYANPDVVAHTGNFEATVKAVRAVDRTLERLSRAIIAYGHVLVITADHGNAEVLMGPMSGKTETKHNTNPVPIYIVAKELQRKEPGKPISTLENVGLLSDVAPTILELMHIPKPPEMTGQSLLDQLLYH